MKEEFIKEIDSLIDDYHMAMRKSMDEDDEERVLKFNGAIVALEILKTRVEAQQ